MKINKKKIGLGIIVFLIIAQFFRIDKTNPPVDPMNTIEKLENAPQDVTQLLERACYDCHSNNTNYPWYTNIAPVSWWVKRHINKGRAALNYSEWGTYSPSKKQHKKEESADFIEKGWMPIGFYKIMHSEARITDEERKLLVDWFRSI